MERRNNDTRTRKTRWTANWRPKQSIPQKFLARQASSHKNDDIEMLFKIWKFWAQWWYREKNAWTWTWKNLSFTHLWGTAEREELREKYWLEWNGQISEKRVKSIWEKNTEWPERQFYGRTSWKAKRLMDYFANLKMSSPQIFVITWHFWIALVFSQQNQLDKVLTQFLLNTDVSEKHCLLKKEQQKIYKGCISRPNRHDMVTFCSLTYFK